MQFSSAVFLIMFLPAVMILYYCGLKNKVYKNGVLLLSSIGFYAWGEPLFVFVILASIFVNFIFGKQIAKASTKKKKVSLLVISLIFNIGILFIAKYLTFVSGIFNGLFNTSIIKITLPIGISFYTFQIMSYIFDVYFERSRPQNNIFHLALYVLMFPQLIAGPIVRYNSIEWEIQNRKESFQDFQQGISRFVIGLSKKVLLADFLAGIADKIFITAEYTNIVTFTAWLGAIAYTLQIYYDFSGYSDMAIGLGKCFGFHFDENFNYPYISRSITEFWKRWHISLTKWFTDYVYIPLGGNRVNKFRHILNLFIIWLLTGIWHGAEWTFIIWGLLYFVFQMIEKYTELSKNPPPFVGHCYTMLLIILNWVIFRSGSVSNAFHYLGAMFSYHTSLWDADTSLYIKSSFVVFIIAFAGCFPFVPKLKQFVSKNAALSCAYEFLQCIVIVTLLICSLLMVVNGNYSPFIYFNF